MKPKYFIDISINPGVPGARRVISRIMQKLHGFFEAHKDGKAIKYAIAVHFGENEFVQTPILRVFAGTEKDIDDLEADLKSHQLCRDYACLSSPKAVPEPFSGTWTSYRKYRIPTVSSDRHANGGESSIRTKRIEEAAESGMGYFILRSSQTGSTFTVFVKVEHNAAPSEECLPDGYGLSVHDRPFAVPDIEFQK
jgi:hypothetical protein